MTRIALVAAVVAGTACLAACGREAGTAVPARRTVEFTGPTMGTTFTVKVVPEAAGLATEERQAIDAAIRDQLGRIDQQLSTWRVDSTLSQFNASDALVPTPVEPETFEVFKQALEMGAFTDGALDVTIGPLVDAWGFGPNGQADVAPTEASLDALSPILGLAHLELDAEARTVRKRAPGVRCDFSSLAAGYAADLVTAMLEQRGHRNFLVDMGGELVARGRNETGRPWQVAVDRPQAVGRAVLRIVPLTDMAIATSGDYRNFREVDGRRLPHILDPRTRRPVTHHVASVTVLDPLGWRADALSTALMVMGPDEGFAFAERHRVPVLMLVPDERGDYQEQASSAFSAWMGTHS